MTRCRDQVGQQALSTDEQAGRSPGHCLSHFAAGPHGGQQQSKRNPATFPRSEEDRKRERNWTLPRNVRTLAIEDAYT